MLRREHVDSSVIRTAGYNTNEKKLFITFHSGVEYAYFDVPLNVFHELTEAPSKGTFFNLYIKGTYAGAEI